MGNVQTVLLFRDKGVDGQEIEKLENDVLKAKLEKVIIITSSYEGRHTMYEVLHSMVVIINLC